MQIAYRRLFGKDLEEGIKGDTSGDFQRLLVSLSTAGREEGYRTDPVKANHVGRLVTCTVFNKVPLQDARDLHRAGEQRLGRHQLRSTLTKVSFRHR